MYKADKLYPLQVTLLVPADAKAHTKSSRAKRPGNKDASRKRFKRLVTSRINIPLVPSLSQLHTMRLQKAKAGRNSSPTALQGWRLPA